MKWFFIRNAFFRYGVRSFITLIKCFCMTLFFFVNTISGV